MYDPSAEILQELVTDIIENVIKSRALKDLERKKILRLKQKCLCQHGL